MSVLEIDKKQPKRIGIRTNQTGWQDQFRRNLYHNNFAKYYKYQKRQDIMLQQRKNQAACSLVSLIEEPKKGVTSFYQKHRQFYDPQTVETFYSPYSVTIPLKNQSYMNDELINTFVYMCELRDNGRNEDMANCLQDISNYFLNAKKKGKQYVQEQWLKIKQNYICELDSVKAVSILIELTRKNSSAMQDMYRGYGQCKKQIFYFKVNRAAMYVRSALRTHQNLKISVDVKDEVNLKTLPMVMKTWYCTLCMRYDCEKHKLDPKLYQYQYHYVSIKNKKSQADHIQNIAKLLKFYETLKKDGDMAELEEKEIKNACGQKCYLRLVKKDIPKLYSGKFKLISPLAKSLLQMGVHIFSYNPCQIHQLFQSRSTPNAINCSQIFIHFTQQSDLGELISRKMERSEIEHLRNEDQKLINVNIKITTHQPKLKRTAYQDKRSKNKNPQFATCMHNFIGHPPIDIKCENCVCRERGFCLPSCLCTQNCEIMRVGCVCRGLDSCQAEKCICFLNKMECQPGLCGQCFASRHQKRNSCKNDQILRQSCKKVNIGISQITGAGLGAFAGQNYAKHDLVCIYSGQHIASEVDFIRQALIKDLSFYNFDSPNGKHITASIDARFMGNKSRFINHASQAEQNLRAETILSNGTEYTALIANKEVQQGDELTFNYDGKGELYLHHRDKYPFIKSLPLSAVKKG